jgi:hypothetical protein
MRTVRPAAQGPLAACITALSLAGCTGEHRYLPKQREALFPRISRGVVRAEQPQTCQQALSPGQAYATYRGALEALQQGQAIASIPHLGCLVPPAPGVRHSGDLYAQVVSEVLLPNVLHDYLQQQLELVIANDIQRGDQRDAGLAWPGAYLLEAAVVAYRNTGETRFLDLFRQAFDQILLRRDSVTGFEDALRQRSTHGWSSINISEEKRSNHKGKPFLVGHITHAARIVYPATEFARLVQQSPHLAARYGADAQRYIAASRAAIDDFDTDWQPIPDRKVPGSDRPLFWYRRPITNSLEATNHVHMVASTWLNLAQITGQTSYRKKAKDVLAVFQHGIARTSDNALYWNYFPSFANDERRLYHNGHQLAEYTWKASLTTPFIARAHRTGLTANTDLARSIAKAINTQVLGQGDVRRSLAPATDAWFTLKNRKDRKKLMDIPNITYFLEYASLEPEITHKLRVLFATRPDIFELGWLGSAPGALGYAHLLRPTTHQP